MEQKETTWRDEWCCVFYESGDRDMREFYMVGKRVIRIEQPRAAGMTVCVTWITPGGEHGDTLLSSIKSLIEFDGGEQT